MEELQVVELQVEELLVEEPQVVELQVEEPQVVELPEVVDHKEVLELEVLVVLVYPDQLQDPDQL